MHFESCISLLSICHTSSNNTRVYSRTEHHQLTQTLQTGSRAPSITDCPRERFPKSLTNVLGSRLLVWLLQVGCSVVGQFDFICYIAQSTLSKQCKDSEIAWESPPSQPKRQKWGARSGRQCCEPPKQSLCCAPYSSICVDALQHDFLESKTLCSGLG